MINIKLWETGRWKILRSYTSNQLFLQGSIERIEKNKLENTKHVKEKSNKTVRATIFTQNKEGILGMSREILGVEDIM